MKFRTTAIAATFVSAAVLVAGCNDDAKTPAATGSNQPAQSAADTSSANAPTDNNMGAGNVAPPAQAPQAQSQRYEPSPRPAALPPRSATRTIGAGVRARINVFYDDLGRYGSWVRHRDFSYVWLPARQGRGWRPYQEGRWVWTDDYGWYWESAEPFAWAVYHYGRWDYDPDYGWFWIPGDTWAPAWVTWRHGRGRIGWAPIGPDRRGYAVGAPRRFAPPVLESWVFVDERNFADPDLGRYTLPIRQIGAMLDEASELERPLYENGVVINRGIRREEIERAGGRRIERREVVYVGNDADAFEDVRGARIGIYRPVIEDIEVREPPRVVVADVTRVDRVVIREYTEARAPGVPSVVLLTVLDNRERQTLQDDRLTQQEAAVDSQIEHLKQQRAVILDERRREAERLQTQIEQERQEGIRQRMEEQQRLLEMRRQRAEIIQTIDTPPASTMPSNRALSPRPAMTAPAAPPAAHEQPPAPGTAPAPPPVQHAPAPSSATAPPGPATQPPSSAAVPAAPPARHGLPPDSAIAPPASPAQHGPPPESATAPGLPPAEHGSSPGATTTPAGPEASHVPPPAGAIAPTVPPASHEQPPASATPPGSAPAHDPPPPASAAAPVGPAAPPPHVPSPAPATAPTPLPVPNVPPPASVTAPTVAPAQHVPPPASATAPAPRSDDRVPPPTSATPPAVPPGQHQPPAAPATAPTDPPAAHGVAPPASAATPALAPRRIPPRESTAAPGAPDAHPPQDGPPSAAPENAGSEPMKPGDPTKP